MQSKYKNGERVVCINNHGVEDDLVLNRIYIVKYDKLARTDKDYINGFYEYRFVSVKDYRKMKLEKIIRNYD